MKKPASLLTLIVALVLLWAQGRRAPAPERPRESVERTEPNASSVADEIAAAFQARRSDVQVAGAGIVTRVLSDDNDGSRHQRFILRLADGQTVLVAHNIDLAPRIPRLERGDSVAFFGEYEYNADGGVIHWTHRDPAGRHVAGWVERAGRRFQ